MKKRMAVLVLFGVLVALALVAMAPGASASMVTKIMYAQENTNVFEWTATFTGDVWIHGAWLDRNGVASSVPVSEVDIGFFGPQGKSLYVDVDDGNLYTGVNPVESTQSVTLGKTYYISVFPYMDDCKATIDLRRTDATGAHLTCSQMGVDASGNTTRTTVTMPQTVDAFASNGEVYVPPNAADGAWISCLQYWPGTVAGPNYASWDDYAYTRGTATDPYDTFSEAYVTMFAPTQAIQRQVVKPTNPPGTLPNNPSAGQWVAEAPDIWPSRSMPNVGTNADAQPGSILATKAPLWNTYAYTDPQMTTQTPGYMFSPSYSVLASQHNYSGSTSGKAAITYAFSGTSIDWIYTTTPLGTLANILIDGVAPTPAQGPSQVDQSSTGYVYKVKTTWTGLAAGNHTITITHSGLAGTNHVASPTTRLLTHDRFGAKGINDPSDPTPYAENKYDGSTTYRWAASNNAGAHGLTYGGTTSTNDAVSTEFSGTSIDVIYTTYALGGLMNVYIDGVSKGTIDCSSVDGASHYQVAKSYTGLTPDTHIILLVASGTAGAYHPATPTTKMYTIDAFKVGATYIEN
jgi:hypothetical protein